MKAIGDTVIVKPIQIETKVILLNPPKPETGEVVSVGDKCIRTKVGDIVVLAEDNFDIEENGLLFIKEKDILIK